VRRRFGGDARRLVASYLVTPAATRPITGGSFRVGVPMIDTDVEYLFDEVQL
jgi:hypothetical protein